MSRSPDRPSVKDRVGKVTRDSIRVGGLPRPFHNPNYLRAVAAQSFVERHGSLFPVVSLASFRVASEDSRREPCLDIHAQPEMAGNGGEAPSRLCKQLFAVEGANSLGPESLGGVPQHLLN